jgi:hypothetical protein
VSWIWDSIRVVVKERFNVPKITEQDADVLIGKITPKLREHLIGLDAVPGDKLVVELELGRDGLFK